MIGGLWNFVQGCGHFFFWHLWHTDYTSGRCCMAMYVLKFPRGASTLRRDSEPLLPPCLRPWSHNLNHKIKSSWFVAMMYIDHYLRNSQSVDIKFWKRSTPFPSKEDLRQRPKMMSRTWALMISSKKDFLFQCFQAVNSGLFFSRMGGLLSSLCQVNLLIE